MTKKNKIMTLVFICGCILAIAAAALITILVRSHFGNKNQICEGVRIGTQKVGGMTREEAEDTVKDYISRQENRSITINIDGESVAAVCSDLGFSYDEEIYIEEALAVGKTGNIWHRLKEMEKAESGEITFPLEAQIDEETLADFVKEQCSSYNIKMKNSRLKMKDGNLVATKSRTGREVQEEKTIAAIKAAIENADDDSDIVVEAVVKTTEPEYTQEQVAECTDVLGSYSTSYSTWQTDRSSNISVASNYINGTMVYPGETFSTVKVIRDRTEANGYKAAPEYSSGKVVDGIGGGVCQVSTTLYNAVINAELEVVERSPHSMVVSYVDVSRDAAIAGDYKDFKFKNNLSYPIYIAGSAYGGTLSFKIYGYEEREAGREISFESEITETIEPGEEVVTEDESKPSSYREVTQSAHVGYRAKLWKIVRVNGVEQERIQVNSSSYNASPQYVTVGKQEEPSPSPETSEKPSNKKSDKKASGKSSATPTPKSTPKSSGKAKTTPTPKPSKTSGTPTPKS